MSFATKSAISSHWTSVGASGSSMRCTKLRECRNGSLVRGFIVAKRRAPDDAGIVETEGPIRFAVDDFAIGVFLQVAASRCLYLCRESLGQVLTCHQFHKGAAWSSSNAIRLRVI